jgi:hypothetical protein
MYQSEAQRVLDEEHLRLLRIGYLVEGWITVAFAFFPMLYVGLGLLMTTSTLFGSLSKMSGTSSAANPAAFMGAMFIGIGLAMSVIIAAVGVLRLFVARALRERRSRTFIMVVAVITCTSVPYGTVLGVLTLIVLSRSSVVELFGERPAAPAPAPMHLG